MMADLYVKDHTPKIIQWILDTRPLWQMPKKSSSREEVAELRIIVQSPVLPTDRILTPNRLQRPSHFSPQQNRHRFYDITISKMQKCPLRRTS